MSKGPEGKGVVMGIQLLSRQQTKSGEVVSSLSVASSLLAVACTILDVLEASEQEENLRVLRGCVGDAKVTQKRVKAVLQLCGSVLQPACSGGSRVWQPERHLR